MNKLLVVVRKVNEDGFDDIFKKEKKNGERKMHMFLCCSFSRLLYLPRHDVQQRHEVIKLQVNI